MKVLVTGCAGFIGWRVCQFLLAGGHAVLGVDNLNDTYDVLLKRWRLRDLEERPGFRFQLVDVVEREALRQVFQPRPDAVINLAARAGVSQSVEEPWAYFQTNVTGTLNLLELCRERGVEKFVQASTSSVYGACNSRPFREDTNTDRPLSPYAASKKGAEALCYTYHYLYGTDVTVLRYFTVYGPAGRPDMSIFRFIRWIAEGEPVILYGDGSQERDFTYVDDIARGTVLALKPLGYEVINVGSDRPEPLHRVIALLEDLLGKEARIERQAPHPSDIRATWADISRARGLLGWEPRVILETGLPNAVRWYQENRTWAKEVRL